MLPATITCKETDTGETYLGTRSITRTDKPCQRWDSQSPHEHDFTDPDLFPDEDLEAAGSYCRYILFVFMYAAYLV